MTTANGFENEIAALQLIFNSSVDFVFPALINFKLQFFDWYHCG